MIWSSRAQNRSADPVVSCFFVRIALSNAATESCFSIRGNRENEIASFQGLRHGNLAISSQQSRQKKTLAQWVRNSSRATKEIVSRTAFRRHSRRDRTQAMRECPERSLSQYRSVELTVRSTVITGVAALGPLPHQQKGVCYDFSLDRSPDHCRHRCDLFLGHR